MAQIYQFEQFIKILLWTTHYAPNDFEILRSIQVGIEIRRFEDGTDFFSMLVTKCSLKP